MYVMHGLIVICFIAGVGTAAITVLLGQTGSVERAAPFNLQNMAGLWFWMCTAIDLCLTSTLFVLLRKHYVEDLDRATIKRILRLAIQTASYTSVMTLGGALTAVIWPASDITKNNSTCTSPCPASTPGCEPDVLLLSPFPPQSLSRLASRSARATSWR